jgi:putative PIN family toxin of toxin-antitoxin system
MAIESGITLLDSTELIQELEDTLSKPKLQKYVLLSGKTPSELVAEFTRLVTLVEPATIPEDAVRDPDDVKVLAAAVGGKRLILSPVTMTCLHSTLMQTLLF